MSEVQDEIIRSVGFILLQAAKSACKSRTLREALTATIEEDRSVSIGVPHYWAPFFDQGHGPVSARPGHRIVFYKNPKNDPRIAGGYPVKLSDVRRLTKAEFYRDLKAGKLVVKETTGPAAPREFLGDSLTVRAKQLVQEASLTACSQAVKDSLGSLLNVTIETKF